MRNRSRRLTEPQAGAGNLVQLVGDYTNPILKSEAAEIVKQHAEMSLAGIGYPTPRNQCWPGGVPFVLPTNGMQMFQQSDKITIVYAVNHQVRHVRMNQPHPELVTPSWYGDSVGHYEGDALVIDTVAIKWDRLPWSTGTARRTRRLCTWSSDTVCLTMRLQGKQWIGTQKSMSTGPIPIMDRLSIRTTGVGSCSSK